jgi:hypothetical protein
MIHSLGPNDGAFLRGCCQQRAEQPGGGRCAKYDMTVTPAVTTKTSAKIIAICFIIGVASFAPTLLEPARFRDRLRQLKVRIAGWRSWQPRLCWNVSRGLCSRRRDDAHRRTFQSCFYGRAHAGTERLIHVPVTGVSYV